MVGSPRPFGALAQPSALAMTITDSQYDAFSGELFITFSINVSPGSFTTSQIVFTPAEGPQVTTSIGASAPDTLDTLVPTGLTAPGHVTITGHPEITNPTAFPVTFI